MSNSTAPALSAQAERYAARIAEWSAESLLDSLAHIARQNKYGENDEQMQVIRAEVLRRMR
jgi:hypothetical protein